MSKAVAERLKADGPKRMLALDGGGTRGMISLAILEEIEAVLRRRLSAKGLCTADSFRLSQYFDVIGGTSVGSLIATQLALGHTVAEIRERFEPAARRIFAPSRLARWTNSISRIFAPSLDVRRLRGYIWGEVGNLPLRTDRLTTGLVIVTKRVNTGSVWAVSNNPAGPYFEGRPAEGNRPARIGNGDYQIVDVLQASTAAPSFFTQAQIRVFDGVTDGLFVDGGVSPHNNPALLLFMMAGISGYNFGGADLAKSEAPKPWRLGADDLFIVSVGTGAYDYIVQKSRAAGLDAMNALQGMVADGQELGLTLLQWMSNPRKPVHIDRVIKDLRKDHLAKDIGGHPLLSFLRYDAPLDKEAITTALGRTLSDAEIEILRDFTSARQLGDLLRIGRHAAQTVEPDDFPDVFDAVWPQTPSGARNLRTAAE